MPLLLLAVQAVSFLAGCADHGSPQASPAAPVQGAAQDGLEGLLDSRLGGAAAAIRALVGSDGGPAGLGASPPQDLDGLLARLHPALPQLPIPHPDEEGALAAALQAYGAETGVPVPSAPDLGVQVAPLGMAPDAEYALAQLILAYTQAIHLQRGATSALTPQERLLASGDPGAAQQWLAATQGTPDSLAAERARLLGLVDVDATLQAADLLARTMEQARGPLAHTRGPADAHAAPDPWQLLRGVVAKGQATAAQPAFDPDLRLADALGSLASAYGLPASQIPAPSLPASLDHAVALLVQAKADAAALPDATQAALRILQAAQEAQPTLEAWAALLALGDAPQPPVDGPAALRAALAPAPDPAAIVAAVHGHRPAGATPPALPALLTAHGIAAQDATTLQAALPPAAGKALALLLEAHDGLAAARDAALAPLSPGQRNLLAATSAVPALLAQPSWNATEAGALAAWAKAVAAVGPGGLAALQSAQEDALAQVAQAARQLETLRVPSQPQSGGVPDVPHIPPEPPEIPPKVPQIPLPNCPGTIPSSVCNDDVWFQSNTQDGLGILVTGFGSTRIDGRFAGGAPNLVLDLGGDDTYTVPVGVGGGLRQPFTMTGDPSGPAGIVPNPTGTATTYAVQYAGLVAAYAGRAATNATAFLASGQWLGAAIDAGGNDTYDSSGPAGQGVGVGLGALGVLWDLAGDDTYLHHGDYPSLAQGAGVLGGVGVLADGGGADHYETTGSIAQGASDLVAADPVALPPKAGPVTVPTGVNQTASGTTVKRPFPPITGGGIGLLLDTGAGADLYKATAGQGYASGNGTAGLLVDTEGASTYRAGAGEAFQGGRANAGGLGALVDLGASGDSFSNRAIPGTAFVFTRPGQPLTRHPDTVWVDPDNALGIGIDSSLNDTDGNGLPDLLDTLGGAGGANATELLLGTVAGLASDRDGDRFPDTVEERAGSDPDDPHSTPDQGPQGVLFDDRLLCNQSQPGGCVAANRGDPFACAPGVPLACLSLLTLTGVGSTLHGHPALVSIDLGGNDTYATAVAATYRVASGVGAQRNDNAPRQTNATGLSLDVGGDDRYLTPALDGTQASASVRGAAILLDLDGKDLYRAGRGSQANASAANAVALLADLKGDDTYEGGAGSQAQAQCGSTCGSVAALVDRDGSDTYRFDRQAVAKGGTALLLDLAGADRYESGRTVKEAGLSVAHPNDAFAPQGNATAGGQAVFLDAGAEADAYTAIGDASGAPVDLAPVKDNAVVRNTSPGPFSSSTQARFADNPAGAFSDLDGDGADGWLELVAGTSPNDPADSPGSAPGQLAACQRDPTSCSPGDGDGPFFGASDPGHDLVGDTGLQLAQGLLVGGRGNSLYQGPAPPFVVDLGGDDTYTAAGFASARPPTPVGPTDASTNPGVTLALDVGAGNDLYLPTPCNGPPLNVVDATPVAPAPCPALGAAILGIAVLGDAGGSNLFSSGVRIAGTVQGPVDAKVAAQGLSQGAGASKGVGILATWGASSTFTSDVEVDLQRTGAVGGTPVLSATGNTQGSGQDAGTGLLASFGAGNDTYGSLTVARIVNADGSTLTGTRLDRAQGAGYDVAAIPSGVGATTVAMQGGTGVLFDGGGRNLYRAASGAAQAFAGQAGTVGVLWSGTGDDTYLAGPGSQAASGGGAALLADAGGSDLYSLSGPGCANGQAKGSGALLLDLGGDDLHQAAGCTAVQGAASGVLADLGGNDAYQAGGNAQGDGQGLLLDLSGADAYALAPGGAGEGSNGGLFVDAGGLDTYPSDRAACTAQAPDAPAGNQCVWRGSGTGVDMPGLAEALAALGADPLGSTVEIAAPAGTLHGVAPLVATVAVEGGLHVDRVSFLLDGVPVGDGRRTTLPDASPARFQLDLDTASAATPDGAHDVQASAFIVPADPAGQPHPDAYSVQSDVLPIRVDNPPILQVDVQAPATLPGAPPTPAVSPLLGQSASLAVQVSRDLGFPTGTDGTGHAPGATIVVRALPPTGPAFEVLRSYAFAGATTLPLTGLACGPACPDGRYTLEVTAIDNSTQAASASRAVLLDGTAPSSGVPLPRYAGTTFRSGLNDATIPLTSTDGSAPGGVAGVAGVTVLLLRNQGTAAAPDYVVDSSLGTVSGGTPSVTLQHAKHGDTVALVSVATDALGNPESPCQPGEAEPCVKAKLAAPGSVALSTLDFLRPAITGQHVDPLYVRPGAPVAFRAQLTDDGTGVAAGAIQLDDGFKADLTAGAGGAFAYTGWPTTADNQAHQGSEGNYTVTFLATDLAGNQQAATAVGHIDDVAPRVASLSVSYTDGTAAPPLTVGRGGMTARIAVQLRDLSLDSIAGLTADFRAVGGGAAVPCTLDLGTWSCAADLPAATADGSYDVPLRASDKAGNVNAGAKAVLQVVGHAFALTPDPPAVVAVGPDSFTVHWDTGIAATSLLRYGKTSEMSQQREDADLTLSHDVTVDRLEPFTTYFVQAASTSASGVQVLSEPQAILTGHGFQLALPGFAAAPRSGAFPVTVRVTDVAGLGPADVRLMLQDAQGLSSPFEVDHGSGDGLLALSVDTTSIPDGRYHLVVEGTRGDDLVQVTSAAFRVDNTPPVLSPLEPRPGSVAVSLMPLLRLRLSDPQNDHPPAATDLQVEVDGRSVAPQVLDDRLTTDALPQRLLAFRLPDPLSDGQHALVLRATDTAGNVGTLRWNVTVDTQPPALAAPPTILPAGGLPLARPGANVTVLLNLTDPHGVAAGSLVLAAFGGNDTTLLFDGERWTATFRVPQHPTGADLLVLATDRLGNAGLAGRFPLPLDAQPPALDLSATAVTQTGLHLRAILSEAANVTVLEGSRVLAQSAAPGLTYEADLAGLRPGRNHTLTVAATDLAGNPGAATLVVRTLDDTQAPGAVGALRATSDEEGLVRLEWEAAQDDAGVGAYAIARTLDGVPQPAAQAPGNATSYVDGASPPGHLVAYQVRAIDVADNAGPAASASARVLALPHLAAATLAPDRGTTDDPFLVQVLYRNPAGTPADRVDLMVGETAHRLQTDGTDCTAGCLYTGTVQLPPTSLTAAPRYAFRATAGGHTAELPLEAAPTVRLGGSGGNVQGVHLGGHAAPLPVAGLQAALLLVAAALLRRRPA